MGFSIHQLRKLLLSEYYVLNLGLLATYGVFRLRHTHRTVDLKAPFQQPGSGQLQFTTFSSPDYRTLELQVLATLTLTGVFRLYRAHRTLETVAAKVLFFAQAFVIITSLLVDVWAGLHYLVAFLIVFLLVNEPGYSGEDKVSTLTAKVFQEECLTDDGSGATRIVFFYTDWSPECRRAYSLYAELSNRYATDTQTFHRLNVGTWPHLAKALGLELSAASSQMPTVACYEKGMEVGRVPAAGARAGVRAATPKRAFTPLDLVNVLELDRRFAMSMGKGTKTS